MRVRRLCGTVVPLLTGAAFDPVAWPIANAGGLHFLSVIPSREDLEGALHEGSIKKTDQCKPEAMPSTVRHECIFILYAKPVETSTHTRCLKQKTEHHV